MGRPKKTAGESTRQRLLRAAEQEFGAVGFFRARLEDIASVAGIRRSSLLYHFKSKEQLYREVVLSVNRELRQVLMEAMQSPAEAGERLDKMAEALLRFSDERRAAVSMFVRELLDSPPSGGRNIREFVAIIDALEAFLREEAGDLIPAGIPIRASLLHIITSQALRIASGDLQKVVWGEEGDPRLFVQAILNQGEAT